MKKAQLQKLKKIWENTKLSLKMLSYNVANKVVIASNGFYKDDLIPDLNDRILPADIKYYQ